MDKQICIICNEEKEKAVIVIKQTAINRLVDSSKKRLDNKFKVFEKLTSAWAHNACLSSYNSDSKIESARRSFAESIAKGKEIRRSALTFDYKNFCFYCGGSFAHKSAQLQVAILRKI